MQGMNDQKFDAFFRQAAEQHRVPYNPDAWDKMRKKLGRTTGNSSLSAKKILGLALLLMLSGALGTAFWLQTSNQEHATPGEKIVEAKDKSALHQGNNLTPSSAPSEGVVPTRSNERNEKENKQSLRQNTESAAQDSQSADSGYLYEPPQTSASGWMNPGGVEYVKSNGLQPGIAKLRFPSVLPLTVDQEAIEEVLPPVKRPFSPARWRVSLGVSPDISAINLGEASQVGSKVAFGLEYFILPRLSLQTGVIFSNKIYTASGESYRPYAGYWKKYPLPNSIDAQCDVLDIPLNIRYYALNLPRSRVFISGGASSYLMLTENYVYQYKSSYSSYEHQERNENQHYFKVANLSLGYERAVGKRWALQVEPFVKVPVAGVGFGNIKLSTTGLFVALNYRLH